MPISIRESPDPLSEVSRQKSPILAECEAFRALLRDIVRYGRREIVGRSLLIAGHRGSGKTTLVRWAIQKAQEKLSLQPGAARPLLVPLHGPDLLGGCAMLETSEEAAKPKPEDPPVPRSQATRKKEARDNAAKAKAAAAEEKASATRAALCMLTEALHRAYIGELGNCFTDAAERAAAVAGADARGLRELAAQVRVALEHAPSLEGLRHAWDECDRLADGVLFEQAPSAGQGLRELVAAAEVIEGYKRVAGKLEDVDGASKQDTRTQQSQRSFGLNGKDLFNGLTGLLAGGVAGGGILAGAGTARPAVAALAAVVTAVGSAAALNYSSSRQRQSSVESKSILTWDTSIASLDRMLPVMVERIMDAGLAPIFVVDELDKVDHLDSKMDDLIRHLKHLVTEKAFFCFLADRAYYERTLSSANAGIYGREHTFFSGRLLVQYRPADLHGYLSLILDHSAADDNERADAEVWPFLFLERARMHPIDLRRATASFVDERWTISLPPGEIRSREGYCAPVFVQALIEIIVGHGPMAERIRIDPSFARLVYDALYYPVREWESGAEYVDLSRDALATELATRMRGDGDKPLTVNENDLDLLCEAVERLAAGLRDPKQVADSITASDAFYADGRWNVIKDVAAGLRPRLGPADAEGRSRWEFDQYGSARPEPRHPEASKTDAGGHRPKAAVMTGAEPAEAPPKGSEDQIPIALRNVEYIEKADRVLRDLTEDRINFNKLANEFHLLSMSPVWPSFASAAQSLRLAGDKQKLAAAQVINAYAEIVKQSAPALARSFFLAADLSLHLSGDEDRIVKFRDALFFISRYFRFESCSADAIAQAVALYGGREPLMREGTLWSQMPSNPAPSLDSWLGLFGQALSTDNGIEPRPLTPPSYERQTKFFIRYLRGGDSVYSPSLDELRGAFTNRTALIGRDLKDARYGDYALILERLGDAPENALLKGAIEIELGFASLLLESAVQLPRVLIQLCREREPSGPKERPIMLALSGDLPDDLVKDWRLSPQYAVYPLYSWTGFARIVDRLNPQLMLTTHVEAPLPPGTPSFVLLQRGAGSTGPNEIVAGPDIDSAITEAKLRLANPKSPPPPVA